MKTLGHAARDAVVVAPIVVFRPAIKEPIGDGDLALLVANEDRAVIARPASIRGPAEELDRAHVHSAFGENAPGAFFERGVFDQNADALHARQPPHDIAIDPRNGREFSRPIGSLVRPGEPGGFVRLPFGGHAPGHLGHFNPATASGSARRHRCAGRARKASRGVLLPCGADRIPPPESLRSKWRLRR